MIDTNGYIVQRISNILLGIRIEIGGIVEGLPNYAHSGCSLKIIDNEYGLLVYD